MKQAMVLMVLMPLLIISIGSCKKCFICTNSCCRQISTNALICNTHYNTNGEYINACDSLYALGDLFCGNNTIGSERYETCDYTEMTEYEKQRLSCSQKK